MHNDPSRGLSQNQARLFFQDVELSEVLKRHESPFYLYSEELFERNFLEFQAQAKMHMPEKTHLVCYALKANPHPRLLQSIAQHKAGADIVSGGELMRALECGIEPQNIVFSGVGKTHNELKLGLEKGIGSFNVESFEELHELNELACEFKTKAPVAMRLNPDVQAKTHKNIATGAGEDKFGLSFELIQKIYQTRSDYPHIQFVGLSIHIGSQLTQMQATLEAVDQMLHLSTFCPDQLEFLDVGGGLGIDYSPEQNQELIHLEEYMSSLALKLNQSRVPKIVFEPGRWIVGKTGLLLTKVIRTKSQGQQNFAIIDAGMNDMSRVALYEAFHRILEIDQGQNSETHNYHIVGPVCESTDVFARKRPLGKLSAGCSLVICDVGAYGKSMASTYNLRPPIQEFFIEDEKD